MRKIRYVDAINEAMAEEMRRDERVFIMGEDVGIFGGIFKTTLGLLGEFGAERVMDTPISESAIVGAAVGSAITGLRPIAEIMFSDFIGVAMDQVLNQAAKYRYMSGGQFAVPMVLKTNIGSGRSSAAQHSQSLQAIFMHTPGLKVVLPSTPYDAKGLMKAAVRDENPVIYLEHKFLYLTEGEVPEEDYIVPIGMADIKREGKDATIIATSILVLHALKAAEKLAEEGIDVEVIDPRTLLPLDADTIINSVMKTGRAIVVDEGCITGGAGAEITAVIMEKAFDYLDTSVVRLGSLDVPVPFSPSLEKLIAPTEEDIIKAVKRTL